jgi:hypothetical protein
MVTILRRRRVFNQEQRLEFLARFERSGLTQMEFCRRAKLPLSTLSLWRRGPGAATGAAASGPAFAEVRLSAPSPVGAVTLHLPSGAKLEVPVGTDARWLALLLKSVRPSLRR